MRLIGESWDSYRKLVLPPNATREQIKQLRTAFYAGAVHMMQINERIGEPDVSEKEGLATLTSIKLELAEFLKTQIK